MTFVKTYVFIDLETSGIPKEENNKTKITELSMIAVKRTHVLETQAGKMPRVQQKITLCLNPGRLIYPSCTDVTGLCNELLEYEPYFNNEIFNILNNFLCLLQKPVCLIAHNGLNFDYPILKNHLAKLGVGFPDDLLCADSFFAFYDIETKNSNDSSNNHDTTIEESDTIIKEGSTIKEETNTITKDVNTVIKEDGTTIEEGEIEVKVSSPDICINSTDIGNADMRVKNETTPKKYTKQFSLKAPNKSHQNNKNVRRRFPWSDGSKPTQGYRLEHVHKRHLNDRCIESHRAENDCIMLLECVVKMGKDFIDYVDLNCIKFADVKPMEIGVPLGR